MPILAGLLADMAGALALPHTLQMSSPAAYIPPWPRRRSYLASRREARRRANRRKHG